MRLIFRSVFNLFDILWMTMLPGLYILMSGTFSWLVTIICLVVIALILSTLSSIAELYFSKDQK